MNITMNDIKVYVLTVIVGLIIGVAVGTIYIEMTKPSPMEIVLMNIAEDFGCELTIKR